MQGFIDVPAGTNGGTITAFGGSATPFSGTINTTSLPALMISGTQVRDRTANAENSTMLLDNVSVVPEPASAALLGVLGLAFLCARRTPNASELTRWSEPRTAEVSVNERL